MSRNGSRGDSPVSAGEGGGASVARMALGSEAAVSLSSPPSSEAITFRPLVSASDSRGLFQADVPSRVTAPAVSDNAITRGSLASSTTIADLANSGRFRAVELGQEAARPGDGKTPPTVKVQYEIPSEGNAQRPDFIVRKDGSVDIVGDPNKTKQSEIVIAVERESGDMKPTDAQQAATEELTRYLADNIKKEFPQAAQQGVPFEDKQNVVPDAVERQTGARNNNGLDNLPEQTRRQVEDMNRFSGGGRGQMSRGDANDYFPERTVPREPTESERLAAMKDVVAGFSTRGVEKPYEHVGHRRDKGTVFGRYGMGFNQVSNWLESLDLEAMEELERQGKLPKGTVAKLKKMKESLAKHKEDPENNKLDPFLEKLKGGDPNNPLTAKDVQENFGKEIQEIAANDMTRKFAWETRNEDGSVDIGKTSLAMHLGRVPTAEDLEKPEYKQLMQASNQAYQIAEARYRNGDSNLPIDWSDANGRTLATAQQSVGRVMWGDFASVVQGGRLGCAASVTKVLEMAGIRGIRSAGVVDFAGKAVRQGYERLPVSQAQPGDIVYGVEPGGYAGGSAHIGIVGQNGRVYHNRSSTGRWSEDNLGGVFNRGRFGNNIYVLRAPKA